MIQFVLCSLRLFLVPDIIVSKDMAAWMFLHTTQCLVSGSTSYASVYGALRGLYIHFSEAVITWETVSRSGAAKTSSTGTTLVVVPSKPPELLGVFIGDTAG